MATTNDVQEEKPPTTAFDRQVKTLATVMERLSKQNRDLEKQLRQKNAALDNQGANQEGTSVERRNQEGSEGNNALNKQERLDTSHPSAVDTVPPHMVAEMHMMKERMDFMMNALRGRVSSDLDELVH